MNILNNYELWVTRSLWVDSKNAIRLSLERILKTLENVVSIEDIDSIDPALSKQIKKLFPEFRSWNMLESILFRLSPSVSFEDQKRMLRRIVGISAYNSMQENIRRAHISLNASKNHTEFASIEIIFSLWHTLHQMEQSDLIGRIWPDFYILLNTVVENYGKEFKNLFLLDMQTLFREPLSYYTDIAWYGDTVIKNIPADNTTLTHKMEWWIALMNVKVKYMDFYVHSWEMIHIYFALNKANTYPQNEKIIKLIQEKYLPNKNLLTS